MDRWDASEVSKAALHPRLKERRRVIDLRYLVAEHDDHHLARTTAVERKPSS